jgi:hypothetical protein
MFAPCKPLQDSIVFAGKAGAYPSETPFRCSAPGYPPALSTNNILGWKGFPGADNIAYYKQS